METSITMPNSLPCFLTNTKGVRCLPVWRDGQSDGKSSYQASGSTLLVFSQLPTRLLVPCPYPPLLGPISLQEKDGPLENKAGPNPKEDRSQLAPLQ